MYIDPLTASATRMEYADWRANAVVIAYTLVTVSLSVLIHYEGLSLLSRRLRAQPPQRGTPPSRRRVLYGIFSVLGLHIAEIWVFGIAYALMHRVISTGFVVGANHEQFLDYIYFSASVFTTVGFGDLSPVGSIRLMAGMEALTGLVLITWSASFTYFQMERFWRGSKQDG